MPGFVYLWFDKKHTRFYLGKHWGTPNDGYICSSRWMKAAIKRRPQDFSKKIIQWIHTTREELTEAERKWGSLIKPEELGKRYYNLIQPGKDGHWSDDSVKSLNVRERMSRTRKGKSHSPEWCENISKGIRGKKKSPEARQRMSEAKRGTRHSEETKLKMSLKHIGQKRSEETRLKMSEASRGKPKSIEHKRKLSEAKLGKRQSPEHIAARVATQKKNRLLKYTYE